MDVPWIKAKIDTGARTSSLHAFDLEEYRDGDVDRVRFRVLPWQDSDEDPVSVDLPVADRREVRSSSGHVESRVVVAMQISICGRVIPAEITLTNRDSMGFRMLVGREVLEQGFLVDSSRSYLGGEAPRAVKRLNRGR